MRHIRNATQTQRREGGLLVIICIMLAVSAIWGVRQMRDVRYMRIFGLWFLTVCGAMLLVNGYLREPIGKERRNMRTEEVRREATAQALSCVSHDLRTPVNGIIGMTQGAIDAAEHGEDVGKQLRQILVAVQSLQRTMDDLLLGEGKEESEPQTFDGEMLENELRVLVEARAKDKAQSLTLDFSALYGWEWEADYTALIRIMTNLLTNAIKYTQDGGDIWSRARIVSRGQDGACVAITVADNGKGMTPKFMEHMYEPYARAPETAYIEGTGLGLAMVAELVRRMKGTIQAQSEKEKGTVFTLSVPLSFKKEKMKPACRFAYAGRRFLVAEDNMLAAQIVIRMLEDEQAEVCWVRDGEEAVERFKASREGEFDAVLMDMRMPRMDGCTAAQALRSLPHKEAAKVPVIAMTAGVDRQDKERVAQAGMDGYIIKPVDLSRLSELLADKVKVNGKEERTCPEREEGNRLLRFGACR